MLAFRKRRNVVGAIKPLWRLDEKWPLLQETVSKPLPSWLFLGTPENGHFSVLCGLNLAASSWHTFWKQRAKFGKFIEVRRFST